MYLKVGKPLLNVLKGLWASVQRPEGCRNLGSTSWKVFEPLSNVFYDVGTSEKKLFKGLETCVQRPEGCRNLCQTSSNV